MISKAAMGRISHEAENERNMPIINARPMKPNRPKAAERITMDIVISRLIFMPLVVADCIML